MPFAVGLGLLLLAQGLGVHTTHYPRHGGLFFTAFNDRLHVEGTWPAQRLFRVYLSEVDGRAVSIDRLKAISGTVEAGGEKSRLRLRDDGYFEARLPTLKVPAEILLVLEDDGDTGGMNFIFASHSDERALSFALLPTVIPDTLAATLGALRRDVADATDLIKQQQSAFVFAPAVRARDHALSLERFLPASPASRAKAEAAIRETVRVAWLLHIVVDEGSVDDVQAALDELRRAVDELPAVLGSGRR